MSTVSEHNKWDGKETVCAILREIHEREGRLSKILLHPAVFQHVAEVHALLAKATTYAKKMDKKLREYKMNYVDELTKEIGNGENSDSSTLL